MQTATNGMRPKSGLFKLELQLDRCETPMQTIKPMEIKTVQSKPTDANFEFQKGHYQPQTTSSYLQNIREGSPKSSQNGGIYTAITDTTLAQTTAQKPKDKRIVAKKQSN